MLCQWKRQRLPDLKLCIIGRMTLSLRSTAMSTSSDEVFVTISNLSATSPNERPERLNIAKNWLPRYTGMSIDQFGDYILLTNFRYYLNRFAEQFSCDVHGEDRPMQAATNSHGLSIINFGIGSANVATIMDLLIARQPKGVLFLGKCGGLKRSTEIGHFILPSAAVRSRSWVPDVLRSCGSRRRRLRPRSGRS